MAVYETYGEMATDLDTTEEELRQLFLARCPKRDEGDQREITSCKQCARCGELPF